jgi:hypothetical protein
MAKAQRAQTSVAPKRDAGTSVTVAPADRIAQRAYEIWKECGCPHGHDQEHWFQAERELRGGAARR